MTCVHGKREGHCDDCRDAAACHSRAPRCTCGYWQLAEIEAHMPTCPVAPAPHLTDGPFIGRHS